MMVLVARTSTKWFREPASPWFWKNGEPHGNAILQGIGDRRGVLHIAQGQQSPGQKVAVATRERTGRMNGG